MKKPAKKYPISIAKYAHTLIYLRDAAYQKERPELAEEAESLRQQMYQSSTDGRIGWLPGKAYERVREMAIMAAGYMNAMYQSRN